MTFLKLSKTSFASSRVTDREVFWTQSNRVAPLGFFIAFLLFSLPVTVAYATVETFSTATSSAVWVAPTGVTSVQIECWGAGGAGGGSNSNNSGGGGGGGGGAYAIVNSFSVTPGNSYNYTVGAGGTGVNAASGNPGGNSTFNGTTCVAAGGGGGVVDAGGGGAGGTVGASTGDTRYAGGSGANSTSGGDTPGGGGGSSAGTGAGGNNGSGSTGATAPTGGGNGGNGGTTGTQLNGYPGSSPGGGGGGGLERQGGSQATGGSGAAGQIRLTYTADTSVTYSGTLYSDEGNTTITTGKNLTLRIGTSTPSLHSTTTRADGTWAYKVPDGSNISAGNIIHIWLDGVTEKAVRVTKVNNNNNVSGLDLYQNRVIVSHETGQTSITNANLGVYDGDDDADIQFTSNAGALSVRAGNELHVWTGDTFAPGGSVTIHGDAGSGVDGSFHLPASATYTAGGVTTIAGNFTASSSATYNPSGNDLYFNATTTGKVINTTFTTLGNTNFTGAGGGWSFTQSAATTTNFTITGGTVTAPSTLAITGNYGNTGGNFTDNSGTIYFNSNSGQNIAGTMTTSATDFASVAFLGSGTKTFLANASTTDFTIGSGATVNTPTNLTIAGNYTNNGSITTDGDTVNFNGTSPQTIAGTMTTSATDFNNVIFSGAGTKTFSNNASTTNFTIQSGSGAVTTPTNLTISGNYSNSGNITHSGTVNFNGGSAQTLAGEMTDLNDEFGNIIFSGAGTKTFSNNASTSDFTIQSGSGDVTAPTYLSVWDLTIGSGTTFIAPSGSLSLVSAGNYLNNGTFTHNSGTVYFGNTLGSGGTPTIAGTMTGSSAFNNVIFGGEDRAWSFSNNASTTGDFIIESGTQSVTAPSGYLSIGGDYSNSANSNFLDNSGTVIFDGSSAQNIAGTMTGSTDDFANVIFRGAGTKTFSNNASTTNFTIKAGATVVAPAYLTISGNYAQSGDFTDSLGTVRFNGSSAQSLSGDLSGSTDDLYNVIFSGAGVKSFPALADIAGDFTIESGASINAPSTALYISGDYTQNGSFNHNNGTVYFNGASPQTLSGTMNTAATDFNTLAFFGAGTKTFANNASTTGSFTIDNGGVTVITPAYLSISGSYNNIWNSTLDTTSNSTVIHFNGSSAQVLSGQMNTALNDFSSLIFSGAGTKTFNTHASTTGDFTIQSGATVVASTSPITLTIAGDYSNAGSFTDSLGTVHFNGASPQIIAGTMNTSATDFNKLIFSGAGTKTFSNNASTSNGFTINSGATVVAPTALSVMDGDFENNGTFTNNSGVVHFDSSSISQNIDGTLTGSSAFHSITIDGLGVYFNTTNASTTNITIKAGSELGAPPALTIAGNYTNNGFFYDFGGTVNFNGGSAQAISGTMNTSATDFYNLIFSGAGTKTLSDSVDVQGNFTIESGASVVAPSILNLYGNYSNSGSFDHNSGTLQLVGSGSQTLSGTMNTVATDFNTVLVGGSSTFVNNASTTNLTINGFQTLVAPSHLSVSGNYTNNGNFTDSSGTVIFNGTSAQTIAGQMTGTSDDFASVVFSGAGTKSFSNNASTTNFTIRLGSGAVTAPAVLTIAGNYSNTATFTHNSGLVHFDSTSAQNISGNLGSSAFNDVEFSGSGIKTFSGTADVADITINSGASVVAPSSNLYVYGNYTNNGNFDHNSGTVNFNGSSAQVLSGEMAGTSDDFNHVTLGGAGTKTFSNNASTTNFTISGGSGTVTAPTVLSISGNYSNSATFTHNSGTVYFSGGGAQSIAGTLTGSSAFNHLNFLGAGTKTFSNNASTTNFTIESGSGAVTAPSGVLSIAGNYANNSAFTDNNGTVLFNGASAQSISGQLTGSGDDFSNLVFSGAGTKTFLSAPGINGDFTIQSGSAVVANAGTWYVSGDYTNNGSFDHNAGTLNFSGSSAQSISGTLNTVSTDLGNVIFSNPGTKTFLNNASTSDFTINPGLTVVAPTYLSIADDYFNDGSFDHNSGTVLFDDSTNLQTISGTANTATTDFNNLIFRNAGTKNLSTTASTTGDVTIDSGATVSFFPISIAGDFTQNGSATFAAGGTTTLNGTGPQTLSGNMVGSNAFSALRILNTSGAGSSTQSVTFNDNASTTGTLSMNASTSVEFNAGGSYTFENIYLNGASGQFVWLRSTSPGSQYYFHVPGNQTLINYVNVQDSNACEQAILAENGTNFDAGNNSCWSFDADAMPTISSAANQNFVVGQATTTISTITITDTPVPNITAANDIRIIIATTSVDMKWDTTDTTATLGGNASGKASTTVSYSANGDTLIIDVTSDFAGSDILTISGLSFAQFGSFAAPTNALGVRVEGTGTTTNNTDDKTISISGGLTLSNHSAGLPPNSFDSLGSSGTGEPLYTFRLQGVGESVDIDSVVFRLTDVINILTDDLTNLLLYRDTNSDKAYDGGDVAVGGSGSPSIDGALGTITFGTTFTADTTARDYLLIGDYEKVLSGETMTISLDTDDISAAGVTSGGSITPTGSADSMNLYRKGQSQGGGRSGEVGGGPPAGQGQQGGGNEDGGGGEAGVNPDTGESLGNEPGFEAPTTNSGSWTNGGNAYASDGSYASSTAIAQAHTYGTFGFTVPSNNEIVGIEVKFEAHDSDTTGDLDVELTWNGGTNYTTAKNTGTLTATDAVYTLGGPGDTWSHTWTPAQGDDGNFAVRFTSRNDATIGIDAIQVRIYHQTSSSTVGGGGGGGEVSVPNSQFFANVFSALHNLNPFTQILLFVSLMSLSVAFIAYLRARSRKGVFIDPNQCDDG